jgi:WD40 repeat protein
MAITQLLAIPTVAILILALTTPFHCGAQIQATQENRIPLENSANVWFAFTFSKDASLLAAGKDAVRVWDTKTGSLRMSLNDPMFCLAFSPDGTLLAGAASNWNNYAAIWAVRNATQQQIAHGGIGAGNLIRRFDQTNKERINLSAAFSPDTKLLAIGNGDDTLTLWELATGKEITLQQEHSNGAAIGFSQDSKYLASGGRDGTIRVWDVASRSEKHCFRGYPGRVSNVTFGDRDRVIVATAVEARDTKATVFVNRFPDGKELARFPDHYHPVLTADARFLAMLGDEGKTISIRDMSNKTQVFERRAKGQSRFEAMAFPSRSRLTCLQSEGKQLSLLHLNTGIADK